MFADYNLEHWPVVYFKLNDNEITDESFEEYKKFYLTLLLRCKKNNEKMVIICNLNRNGDLPLTWVIKHSQFNKEVYKHNKDFVKAVCIMCKDKNFKNILNLYFTVAKPAAPYKLCRSFFKVNKYLTEKFNMTFDSNIYQDNPFDNQIDDDDSDENCTDSSIKE
jgi:hypothetical protein